jgi:hypothetical protein
MFLVKSVAGTAMIVLFVAVKDAVWWAISTPISSGVR